MRIYSTSLLLFITVLFAPIAVVYGGENEAEAILDRCGYDAEAFSSCDDCPTLVEVDGSTRVVGRAHEGGNGRHAELGTLDLLVEPDTCRGVVLDATMSGGSPYMQGYFYSTDDISPGDEEKRFLLEERAGFEAYREDLASHDGLTITAIDSSSTLREVASGFSSNDTNTDDSFAVYVGEPFALNWSDGSPEGLSSVWRNLDGQETQSRRVFSDPWSERPFIRQAPELELFFANFIDRETDSEKWARHILPDEFAGQGREFNDRFAWDFVVDLQYTRARNTTTFVSIYDVEHRRHLAFSAYAAVSYLATENGLLWFHLPRFMQPGFSLIAVNPEANMAVQIRVGSPGELVVDEVTPEGLRVIRWSNQDHAEDGEETPYRILDWEELREFATTTRESL